MRWYGTGKQKVKVGEDLCVGKYSTGSYNTTGPRLSVKVLSRDNLSQSDLSKVWQPGCQAYYSAPQQQYLFRHHY